MQEKDRNEKKNINEILGMVSISSSEELRAPSVVFEEDEHVPALVFESGEEDEYEQEEQEAELEPRVKFETVKEDKPTESEFTVPEEFKINERYNAPLQNVEDAPRIRTTYVPRFTEVSQNYRMADKNAQRNSGDKKPAQSTKSEEKTAEMTEKIDPTAEIDADSEVGGSVSVNIKPLKEDDFESSSKVFKFEKDDPQPRPISVEKMEEPVKTEEVAEQKIQDEDVSRPEDSEPELFIPDPITETKSVTEYTSFGVMSARPTLEDAPEDVGDKLSDKKKRRSASEYISYSQRDTFKDSFLDGIMSIRVRFFAAAAVALILLIVESLYIFGVDIPMILGLAALPGAMGLIDLQFIICLYLLAIPEVIKSFKYLVRKKAVSELPLTASLIVLLGYSILITLDSPPKYPLFGLVFAIQILSAIGASYFKISADFSAFKVASLNEEKGIVDKRYTRTLEHENAALDGRIEEHRSKIARFFSTVFVSDFFERSDISAENSNNVVIILSSALGASFVTGGISYFVFSGLSSAVISFVLVFMTAVPALSVMLHKLPYYSSEREILAESSAVIGEASLYDYSGIDVITFNDTEVFGSEDVTLQRIMLYGNSDNLTKSLRQMSALFMNVGGPLDILFSDSLDKKCSPAQSTYIESDGVGGMIDGHKVVAGPKEYMIRKGIRIPEDDAKHSISASESTRVMYAAEDGIVYAKFYIRYSFSEEFSMLLPTLEDEGITPLVYTRDPNITSGLLKILTAGADKIRILKKRDDPTGDSPIFRKVSVGLVTTGDKNNVINALLIAKKYSKFQSRLAVTELIAMAVGAALAVVLSLGNTVLVPSFVLATWHAAWCGVLHFLSARAFSTKNKNQQ